MRVKEVTMIRIAGASRDQRDQLNHAFRQPGVLTKRNADILGGDRFGRGKENPPAASRQPS
jgi:hypothetical protein